ncbi:MAG: DUF4249 family protein [Saprospiraceae bacterium]|nr:DUF4249 family protein [Saprospiraceae bacterium]
MQIRFLFILLAFMAGFSSCSNEFELIEEKIETPIVYSLLDYEAPYQYVRLERAFASPNQSAVELAKNPDSLYYKNAIVNLILKRGGVDQTFTLEEVDGNDVGYPRQDGVFAKEPNKLYRINSALLNLVPGDKVKLEVNIGEGNPVTAETTIITKPTSSFPRSGSPVAFSPTQGDNFKWNHVGNFPGSIFNLRAVIHYTEVSAGEATQKSLVWDIAKNVSKENFLASPGEFYSYLGSSLAKSTTTTRFFDGLDYFIYCGDENLSEFLTIGQANTGITGSGELPVYSNLSRGLGIFGSKAQLSLLGLGLAPNTINELKINKLTKDLNFQ